MPDAEEVFTTLRKMSSEKASGPDGMTVLFFKHFWDVVGMDVIKAVQDFFERGELLFTLKYYSDSCYERNAEEASKAFRWGVMLLEFPI